MDVSLTYDGGLSRVRVSVSGVPGGTSAVAVERSVDGLRWEVVRGGAALPVTASAAHVDDYEFTADTANTYRARAGSTTASGQLTPALGGPWLKSIVRPFLNMAVVVTDVGGIGRTSRAGIFGVVGRSLPIAVTDVRTSATFDLQVLTEGEVQATALEALLASGDVVFVHARPGDNVPGGYYAVGDTTERRYPGSDVRTWALPLVETAAPDLSIAGATITYQGVLGLVASYTALRAAVATYADVTELIGRPDDVVVG